MLEFNIRYLYFLILISENAKGLLRRVVKIITLPPSTFVFWEQALLKGGSSQSAELHYKLGKCYRRMGRLQDSRKQYQEVLRYGNVSALCINLDSGVFFQVNCPYLFCRFICVSIACNN